MTNIHQSSAPRPVRVALIGYGNAGRIFHAPLISGVPGLELACICSSKPEAVLADWPQTTVVPTPQDVFADPSIDLVVIATGNESHHPLARAALLAGKHVVVDKPFTVTLEQAHELLQIAKEVGKVATVFQNRRLDADFLALKQVLDSGALGRIVQFESHFDRYRPLVPDRWREQPLPGSGLWMDLGAHLVDQCLQLFGAPDAIAVDLACQRDGAQVNDYFHAQLRYTEPGAGRHPGLRVMLHASALVPTLSAPRFALHGTKGSFVKYGLDVQEDDLKAGGRPVWDAAAGKASDPEWGQDPLVGTVTTYVETWTSTAPAPNPVGNYLAYYARLCDHLQGRAPAPAVTPEQIALTMRVLSLGEQSAVLGQYVPVTL